MTKPPRCAICGRLAHLMNLPRQDVIDMACTHFDVTHEMLAGPRKYSELLEARAFVVWALRMLGHPRSYAEIGRLLGDRDSTTAVNLHAKALLLLRDSADFAALCTRVATTFYASRSHDHGNR